MSRSASPRPSLPPSGPRRPVRLRPGGWQIVLLLLLLPTGLLGCGERGSAGESTDTAAVADARADESATPRESGGDRADAVAPVGGDAALEAEVGDTGTGRDLPLVAFLGNSLTAGYSLAKEQAFPARVEERMAERGLPIRALNAGVSGDTSAGGVSRLDWVLSSDPDVVVVELGANDGLRGLDLEMTESNLRDIVSRARDAGARVLLVGMRIPPNYGPQYAGDFQDLFPRLAEELGVPLVPFLLEGVGGDPELNLPDGIHPTPEGHRRVAANVVPHLVPLVEAEWRERGGLPQERPAAE